MGISSLRAEKDRSSTSSIRPVEVGCHHAPAKKAPFLFKFDAEAETVHKDGQRGKEAVQYLKDQLEELQCLCPRSRMGCCRENENGQPQEGMEDLKS